MRVIMTSNYSKSKRGKNNTSAGRVVKKAKTNNNAKTTKPKALENKHKKTIKWIKLKDILILKILNENE